MGSAHIFHRARAKIKESLRGQCITMHTANLKIDFLLQFSLRPLMLEPVTTGTSSVRIRSFGGDVIASGQVFAEVDGSVEFEIDNLRYVVQFAHDEKDSRVETKVTEDKKGLMLTCYNYGGCYWSRAVKVGTLQGKDLLMIIEVSEKKSQSISTLSYMFLLKEKSDAK